MRNNNKILYISIAILVLAIGIAFGTYAYYQTTISGTISGNVAKWSFTANGQTSSFNLDLGQIYPGVSKTYNIELSAENSDLDVYYELTFYNVVSNTQEDWSHFFWDSNYNVSVEHCEKRGKYGIISAGEKITIPIYFNWPYEGNDDEYWAGKELYPIGIKIIGKQYTAYTGTIPMQLFTTDDLDGFVASISYENGYILTSCPIPN